MATKRRFEAGFDIIVRDLGATFRRMAPESVTVSLGGLLSQQGTRQLVRLGWRVEGQQPDLLPAGAAIGFVRDGRRYRFSCVNYAHPLDNLRAAQRAVTLIYMVYDEYAVSGDDAGEAGERFERLFGGHRLALGDGTTGDAWHEVLKVSPSAGLVVIRASYHALSKVLHPDNRATGDAAAMLRLNRAYEEARQALGVAR